MVHIHNSSKKLLHHPRPSRCSKSTGFALAQNRSIEKISTKLSTIYLGNCWTARDLPAFSAYKCFPALDGQSQSVQFQ